MKRRGPAGRGARSWPAWSSGASTPCGVRRRVAGADVVYPPPLLEDAYLPDAGRIAAALRTTMDE